MTLVLQCFLVGAAGASAPEIVRLHTIVTGGARGFTWSRSYVAVSLVFAALGGLVAVVLPSDNLHAAFFAGVSTPVLINKIVEKAAGNRPTHRRPLVKGLADPVAEERPRSRFDSFFDGL